MSGWKQIALILILVAGAVAAWALFIPSVALILARIGLPLPDAAAEETADGPPKRTAPDIPAVIVSPVVEGAANSRLAAIGDGRAIRSVAVTPLVAGRLTKILVSPGDQVETGDLLARLDNEAESIGVVRAELAVADAEATLERYDRLRGTGATTDVQLREAQLTLDRARLELRDAVLALERRDVIAPIPGIVGILPVEIGQQVTASTEIATIDDRSKILVDFRVPERWVGRIDIGDPLEPIALARPDIVLDGRVHAVDSRIEDTSRTLRVQALISNEGDVLRGGMAFRIGMNFPGDGHPSVDPLSIQWSSDGAFVWVVRNGRTEQVPVRIVQRSSDRVLVSGALEIGDLVVTEGVQSLRRGSRVEARENQPVAPDGEGAGLGLSRAAPAISDT